MNIRRSWDWWRHNHSMNFWPAIRMTFKQEVIWPLNNLRAWFMLRTYRRWQIRRLRKQWKKKFGEDPFDKLNSQ